MTRFAPAPTGRLHLGHVANALYVWGLSRRWDAPVLLRIEDHDRQRSRPEYESHLLDDLDWLGFVPDLFPTNAFRDGDCGSRQSDRAGIYEAAAAELIARGLVYGCTCSRSQAARSSDAPESAPFACPGTCRDRGVPLERDVTWRVRLVPGVERFDDLLVGPQEQDCLVALGDPVIRDRHGNWTYQFAVSVDDWRQGVDLVIRGRDLLSSTGLQIALARLLGREAPPRFAHHPLIMKAPDQKLSKADRDTGIHVLRDGGISAPEVIGLAAYRVGLIDAPRPVDARDSAGLFGN